MNNDRTPDHGEFKVQTSRNDELKIVRESYEKAKVNPVKPGHHWMRFVAKETRPDRTIETIKMYHVDLAADVLEITETVDGAETARRTIPLGNFG